MTGKQIEKNIPKITLNVFYVIKDEYLSCVHFKAQLK